MLIWLAIHVRCMLANKCRGLIGCLLVYVRSSGTYSACERLKVLGIVVGGRVYAPFNVYLGKAFVLPDSSPVTIVLSTDHCSILGLGISSRLLLRPPHHMRPSEISPQLILPQNDNTSYRFSSN